MAASSKTCQRVFSLLIIATSLVLFCCIKAGLNGHFQIGKSEFHNSNHALYQAPLQDIKARQELELNKEKLRQSSLNGTLRTPPKKIVQLSYKPNEVPVYKSFTEAVQARASENNVIVLSSLDSRYVDMAINLWETSFKKFHIANYLFVCTDKDAVSALRKQGLPCYLGIKLKTRESESLFGTPSFNERTHIKTKIILDALKLGYDVLIVDVDIVFLKDPFPFLDCDDCDIQIQDDGSSVNSGFYYVRPTKAAVNLHTNAFNLGYGHLGTSNQQCIKKVLNNMIKNSSIKAKILDTKLFPRGSIFFEDAKRMFADDNPCQECVIIHNNWLMGEAAKIYRFKEFGMWMYDKNGYYSSNDTNYLTYHNLIRLSDGDTSTLEINTLKIALSIGHILNRTVILPTFHCYGCQAKVCTNPSGRCSLNTFIKIRTFDLNFNQSYREHMFLEHPKVPQNVKDSVSPVFLIASAISKKYQNDPAMKLVQAEKTLKPKTPEGATKEEILAWFANHEVSQYKVLHFHSLYGAYRVSEDPALEKLLSASLKRANYRQYY